MKAAIVWTEEETERLALWMKAHKIENVTCEKLREVERAVLPRERWRFSRDNSLSIHHVSKRTAAIFKKHVPSLKILSARGEEIDIAEPKGRRGPVYWTRDEQTAVAKVLKSLGRDYFIMEDVTRAERKVLPEDRWRFQDYVRQSPENLLGLETAVTFGIVIRKLRWVRTNSVEGKAILAEYAAQDALNAPKPAPEPVAITAPPAEPEPPAPAPKPLPVEEPPQINGKHTDPPEPAPPAKTNTIRVSSLFEFEVPSGVGMEGVAAAVQRLAAALESYGGLFMSLPGAPAPEAPQTQNGNHAEPERQPLLGMGGPLPVQPVPVVEKKEPPAPVAAPAPAPREKLPDLRGLHILFISGSVPSGEFIKKHQHYKSAISCGAKITVEAGEAMKGLNSYKLNPSINRVVIVGKIPQPVYLSIIHGMNRKYVVPVAGVTGAANQIMAWAMDYSDAKLVDKPAYVPAPVRTPTLGDVLDNVKPGKPFASLH